MISGFYSYLNMAEIYLFTLFTLLHSNIRDLMFPTCGQLIISLIVPC